jgi:hypothetical protein
MKFMIKARAGLMMTPERKYQIGYGDAITRLCKCSKGGNCHLAHILNGCDYYRSKYTVRHNMVVRRIREAIKRYRSSDLSSEIIENRTISLTGADTIDKVGFSSRIRPDLWFWTDELNAKTLWVVEVKVAWGRAWDDESGGETNTLDEVYLQAEKKYDKNLVDIESKLRQTDKRRTLRKMIMVVSSLGALHKDVFRNARKLLGMNKDRNKDRQAAAILCKRMVKEAIEGSRLIWMKKCGFSFDVDSKRFVKTGSIEDLERKAIKHGYNIDSTREINGMFHDELLHKLENVIKIDKNDDGNIDLKEAIEMIESDNYEDNNELSDESNQSCDEGWTIDSEVDIKVENNQELINIQKRARHEAGSAPPEEVNFILRGEAERRDGRSWSEDDQRIHDKYSLMRQRKSCRSEDMFSQQGGE